MKKFLKIATLMVIPLTLASCEGGGLFPDKIYYNDTSSSYIGLNGDKVQLYDKETNSVITDTIVSPFNSMYLVRRYQKNNSNFSSISNDVRDIFHRLHAEFDSHYDYTINGNLINNLKTINESYGTGHWIEVSDDLYDVLSLAYDLTILSNGSYNVAIGSLSDLWTDVINYNKGAYYGESYGINSNYYKLYRDLYTISNDGKYGLSFVNCLYDFVLSNEMLSLGIQRAFLTDNFYTDFDNSSLGHDYVFTYEATFSYQNEQATLYFGVDENKEFFTFLADGNNLSTLSPLLDDEFKNIVIDYKEGSDITYFYNDDINNSLETMFDAILNDSKLHSISHEIIIPSQEEVSLFLSAVPDSTEIQDVLKFKEENNKKYVRLNALEGAKRNVRLSLGSIGKGYAVQKVVDYLSSIDAVGYVNFGSSSVSYVNSMFNNGTWGTQISNPLYRDDVILNNVDNTKYNISDIRYSSDKPYNFSTSGDYENCFFDENMNRYHHIIDPKTGYSSTYFRTTSVVCSDSSLADAITTALMATDLESGIKFIKKVREKYDIEAYPIWTEQNQEGLVKVYADAALEDSLKVNSTNGNGSTTFEPALEGKKINFIEI